MTITPARFRMIAIAALVSIALITVSGAAVRLTGSGLGCDDWPRCSDERFVDVGSYHAAIEQINRLFTFVIAATTVLAVIGAWRRRPYRRDLLAYSWLLVLGVVANAVLGGISVLVDLHPVVVQGHMLLSMALIAVGTVLVRRAGEPDGVPLVSAVDRLTRLGVLALYAMTWIAVILGTVVTAAGPHAGDEEAERLDIALVTIARVHSAAVWTALAIAATLGLFACKEGCSPRYLRAGLSTWIVAGVVNAVIGYVQYFSGVPPLLVGFHIVGAIAVMWAATNLVLDLRMPNSHQRSASID